MSPLRKSVFLMDLSLFALGLGMAGVGCEVLGLHAPGVQDKCIGSNGKWTGARKH